MTQRRRDFLGTMIGGASWALLSACATNQEACRQQIANRPMRRNIATLSANHPIIAAYKSAVTQMKALPSSDRRNWTRQAEIHRDFCPHRNWLFLPWHRAYLLYFERICRKLSGMADFALPYWNWSTSPSIPAPFWGGSSNPLFDGSRGASAASVASAANIGAPVLTSILNETNFLTFGSGAIPGTGSQRAQATSGRLESTPHNYVHGFVGGNMGNYMSPLDPVFWTHHNMIERCWVEWNFDKDRANTSDAAWANREFTEFCDEDGNPVTVSVATTLLFPVFSYRYDDVGPGSSGADTKALRDASAQKAKSGARVRTDVLRKFAAAERAVPTLERPAAIRIPVDPQVIRAGADGNRTHLVFDGVSLDHTEDFSVRVFINKPDATIDTPPSDPHFAGAFAFFHHDHAGHGAATGDQAAAGNFLIDATDTIKRLNITGGALDVHVVLVPFPGRQPRTRQLTVTTTELRIAKDVVERSQ
jgi:tyrosinase